MASACTNDSTVRDGLLSEAHFADIGELKKHDHGTMDDAKRRARGDLALSEWMRQAWAYQPGCCDEPRPVGLLAVEDARKLSVRDFVERYEKPNLPLVITHAADDWPASHGAWLPAQLSEKFRHRKFKCGEDDDGYPVKVKLKYFLRYMARQRDDSPLYIFDSMYESSGSGGGDDKRRDCPILHDYAVPPYFREDLFRMVGEHRRPPYRWFLVGPKRSGTCVHIDPLNTSAWNTLIYGLKRWVLFPPEFSRDEVKGRAHVRKDRGEDDEAIDYFNRILPRIKEAGGARMAAAIIEFVQRPGETVYVPGGWWHAVHNLTDTVAVTQNYCSTANFCRVWPATRDGRHGMARKWLRLLERERPDLYAAACAMNAADGWSMDAAAAKHKARITEKLAARAKRRAEREAARATKKARVAGAGGLVVDSDSSSDSDSSTDSDESSGSDTSDTSDSDEEAAGSAQAAVPRKRVDATSRGPAAGSSEDEAAAGSSSGAGATARASKKPRLGGADG